MAGLEAGERQTLIWAAALIKRLAEVDSRAGPRKKETPVTVTTLDAKIALIAIDLQRQASSRARCSLP